MTEVYKADVTGVLLLLLYKLHVWDVSFPGLQHLCRYPAGARILGFNIRAIHLLLLAKTDLTAQS